MHGLSTLFLVASLFVPRISLFFLWMSNLVPVNPTPFILDAVLSFFLPRIMVLILIASTYGFGGWFWLHLVVGILEYSGGSSVTVTNNSTRK